MAKNTKSPRGRQAEYSRNLRKLKSLGIYNPSSDELTKYRKTRINKLMREYGSYLDNKKFQFVKVPKEQRAKVISVAKELKMPAAPSGIFIEREGYKTAELKAARGRPGEFDIIRKGKVKRGPRAGKSKSQIIPIAPIDRLALEKDRIRKAAEAFGPLGKNERLAYKVVENGTEGYSHYTFDNPDALIKKLGEYQKNRAAQLAFFRHVIVEKTTVGTWFKEHPVNRRRNRNRGRKKG